MSDNEIKLLEIFAEQLNQPLNKLSEDLQRIVRRHFFTVEWDNFSAYQRLKKLKEIDDLKESSEQHFYFNLVSLKEWLETEYQNAQKKGNDSRALAFTEMQTKINEFGSNQRPFTSMSGDEKEHKSMLKIIHALAKNAYKYPERSSLKAIVKDFEINGNGVVEKTLKKYLNEFDAL